MVASNEHHNTCFSGKIRKISVLFGWKSASDLREYMHDIYIWILVDIYDLYAEK